MMSSAALLGKEESDSGDEAPTESQNLKPFEMAALKARAFRITKKERKSEVDDIKDGYDLRRGSDIDPATASRRGSKSVKCKKQKQKASELPYPDGEE